MWKNSDKRGTKVTGKFPHNKFFFHVHIEEMTNNFETTIDWETMRKLSDKWDKETQSDNF
jgi:hypothetical protein